jgi:PleD family two-component response regulator
MQILETEDSARKLRILAIDDAPVILKTLSTLLSDEYKVYGMSNPTMLEKFLHQITPELFLLDYKMPELSGFDCIPIIRSFEEHKNTPIIFLTSLGTPDHVSAALAMGAADFIVKPFQGNILREKIAKHIVRKKFFL